MTTDNRTNHEIVAEAISEQQACGSCADAQPYCLACSEETMAVLHALESAGRLAEASISTNNAGEPTTGLHFTEAQVEAAAKAMWDLRKLSGDPEWDVLEYGVKNEYRKDARAALVATQEAAPQSGDDFPMPGKRLSLEFRADIVEAARERIQTVWNDVPEGVDALTLAQNIVSAQEFFWLSLHFPVLPSSGVDEDKLAEVIEQARDRSRKDRDITKESLGKYIARIVNERRAEWLKGR